MCSSLGRERVLWPHCALSGELGPRAWQRAHPGPPSHPHCGAGQARDTEGGRSHWNASKAGDPPTWPLCSPLVLRGQP